MDKKYKLRKTRITKKQKQEYINKIVKRDIIMYSILIFSIIFLASTSTYAFLTTEVNTVKLENIVSSTIEGVTISKSEINISNLNPSTETEILSSLPSCISNNKEVCSKYEFTVNNENTEVAKNITYYLKNINNTFNNLKFKVYEGPNNSINSSSISLYNSNKLTPNIKELEITGLNKHIKANTNQTYTIVFYVEKTENQEMYDALKEFNASILIDLKVTGYVGE